MAETTETPAPLSAPEQPTEKKLRFPTAFTVLAAVLLPSCSQAQGDALCVETSFDQRLKQLWIAPPNGLYGVENDRGFVAAHESGFLYGSAMIFLLVLAVGAFSP